MVLRIKNFNIMGFTEKSDFQGVHKKAKYRGELPKKGGFAVCRFMGGGLAKKNRVVFLRGVDNPMHTLLCHL